MRLVTAVLSCLAISLAAASTAQAKSEFQQTRKHISNAINNTHLRQNIMGVRSTPTHYDFKRTKSLAYLRWINRLWNKRAFQVWKQFLNPPNKGSWFCIHRYEGSWQDADDPYWGGLQMDRGFMGTYAPGILLRRGWANRWTPLEQMWVAERAHASRGFGPWPNTARYCGLL